MAPPSETDAAGGQQPPLHPPITLYKARRVKTRKRGWIRVVLWSTLSLILIAAAVVGGVAYFKVWQPLQQVSKIDAVKEPDLANSQKELLPPLAGQPTTALVLGYDRRAGDGNSPSRSDTLMLLRVDPKRKTLQLLSIPRDLQVPIPGYSGIHRINEAYSLGKSQLALKTVQQLFAPLKINYLIPVNFRGFTDTVNKLGHGVWLPVDRRYFNQNDGTAANNYSAIDLQAGYQMLNGAQALAYVRYRHTDSDLFRLARQQTFVREFKREVDAEIGVQSIGEFVTVIDIIKDNVKIVGAKHHEPGPTTMIRYARTLASIPRSRMFQVRLTGGGCSYDPNVVCATTAQVEDARRQFLSPNVQAGNDAANRDVKGTVVDAKPTKPTVKPVPPAKLRVLTLNGSHIDLAATTAAQELRGAGWKKADIARGYRDGNAWRQNFYGSAVFYTSGRPAVRQAAVKLALALGDATPHAAPRQLKSLKRKADVVVVTGSQWNGVIAPPAPVDVPAAAPPDTQPTRPPTWRSSARGRSSSSTRCCTRRGCPAARSSRSRRTTSARARCGSTGCSTTTAGRCT